MSRNRKEIDAIENLYNANDNGGTKSTAISTTTKPNDQIRINRDNWMQ